MDASHHAVFIGQFDENGSPSDRAGVTGRSVTTTIGVDRRSEPEVVISS